ncbi:terminase small subunit [Bacillus massiliigorillae]|uniref:terminase small subunit n=1 Tax=Bacillus massiliigorillae TaxID=1243664 RepID=UPI0003A6F60F|nr:terminase small subunit [Bacillus massiliigorillae]
MPSVTRNHVMEVHEVSPETVEALNNFKPLNDRQRKFVHNYLLTGSVPEASKRAGYNSKHGWALLNRPDINNFIKEHHKYWTNEEIASVEEVLVHLSDIVRGEATDVIINAKTGKRETIPAPTLARLKALEHLTKAYGMNNNNITINGSINHMEAPKREIITAEELKDIIELSKDDFEIVESEEE